MKKSIVKIFAPLMMAVLMLFSVVFAAGCNTGNTNNTKEPLNLTTASAVYDLKGPMIDGVEATAEEKETYQLQEPMYCFARIDFEKNKVTFYYMFIFNEEPIETTLDVTLSGGENGVYTLTAGRVTAQLDLAAHTIIVLEDISGDTAVVRNVEWTFEYFEAVDFDLSKTIRDRMDAFYESMN